MKNILLVNDDGIHSPGLAALHTLFAAQSDFKVRVIAPDGQRSAGGQAITLFSPIRITEFGSDRFAIDASPADCVYLGMKYFDDQIDLVVSGINSGQNMGVDIYYSGTVAAAREAIISGIPAMAVSLSTKDAGADFSPAAECALKYARFLFEHPLPKGTLLNINLPNLPAKAIRGVKMTRLGRRVYLDGIDKRANPFGQKYCWRICEDLSHNPCAGGDLDAVEAGYIALTPIQLDATDYASASAMAKLIGCAADGLGDG
ncbi:MAG: 5'/3'-nucleotidase SurE [Spirochaetota bacterium]|jgi:5'-nucleotidase|nr:5'/3'-nucleotidase SurE [Spirochaetota bacterium]